MNIEQVLREYYEIKTQIDALENKRKQLKETLLQYLETNQNDQMYIAPYKVWYLEMTRFSYNIKDIHDRLEPKGLFLEVVGIKGANYRNLLTSNKLTDEEAEVLMNSRTALSTKKYLYFKRYGS